MDYDFYNPYLLNKLDTIDAEELMATPYAPKNFIVADMLPEGLTLLCGPSNSRQNFAATRNVESVSAAPSSHSHCQTGSRWALQIKCSSFFMSVSSFHV